MNVIKLIIAILIAFAMTTSCNQPNTSIGKDAASLPKTDSLTPKNTAPANNLDFLKQLNGKYPAEVALFADTVFTQRLKKLIGDRFEFLMNTWAVETPIEFDNNTFVASACQSHNCSGTNFIIVYDFSKNVMYAGIKEEDKVDTYAEDGGNSAKITEWEDRNRNND